MRMFLAEDTRFLGLADALADCESAGVLIVPVPFERTSSYGVGSARGPEALLAASHQVEFFDADLGFEPCEAAGGIATLSPMPIDEEDEGKSVCDLLEREVSHWLEKGKQVITLGGEHTSVVGAIRAHARHCGNLTVLQLDAHSDLRETYEDNPWNHACAMARVLDFHSDLVQAGIRSEAREERERVERMGLPVFRSAGIKRKDNRGEDWVGPIIEACSEKVYVTFDCDVLDPSIMPATGTPEPGGLTWEQVNALMSRLCREREVVGFDLSELCPLPKLHYPEFIAAKLVYRLIGYLFNTTSSFEE